MAERHEWCRKRTYVRFNGAQAQGDGLRLVFEVKHPLHGTLLRLQDHGCSVGSNVRQNVFKPLLRG